MRAPLSLSRALLAGAAALPLVGACIVELREPRDQPVPPDGSDGGCVPAVEDCATTADEDCDGRACSGDVAWGLGVGSASDDWGSSVALDDQGNALVIGTFAATLSGQPPLTTAGGNDAVVIKLDPSGALVWRVPIGGVGDDYAPRYGPGPLIAVDGDGAVYAAAVVDGDVEVAGVASSGEAFDVLVVKLSAEGEVVWLRRFGDALGQEPAAVAVGVDGDVLVSGTFEGTLAHEREALVTSAGDTDVFLLQLAASDGAVRRATRLGDDDHQEAVGLAVDSTGGVLLGGVFHGSLDVGLPDVLEADPSGDDNFPDLFLVKLAPDGSPTWAKEFGRSPEELPEFDYQRGGGALAIGPADQVFVTGWFHGVLMLDDHVQLQPTGSNLSDVFVARIDAAGNVVWAKAFGNEYDLQVGWSIGVDSAGQVLVAGNVKGSVDFGNGATLQSEDPDDPDSDEVDAFALKLDPLGLPVWVRALGGAGRQRAHGIAVRPGGGSVVTGWTDGTIVTTEPPIAHQDGDDLFVVDLAP